MRIPVGALALVVPEDTSDGYRDFYILWEEWGQKVGAARVGFAQADDVCIVLERFEGSAPPGVRILTSAGAVGWINERLLREVG